MKNNEQDTPPREHVRPYLRADSHSQSWGDLVISAQQDFKILELL